MKIKSKEVAKALGVSAATVSLAINGKPGVNEETRQRILEFISGQEGKSQISGEFVKLIIFERTPRVLIGEIRTLFRNSFLESVRWLQKENIEVKLVYAYGSAELEEVLQKSNSDGTRGIILGAEEFTEQEFSLLSLCRIPLVLTDCGAMETQWNVVNFNNRQAVFMGMEYLKRHGCSSVVYFSNAVSQYNFRTRKEAYRNYLQKNPELRGDMIEAGNELKEMEETIYRYFSGQEKLPDAVFMENFMVSIAVVRTLVKMGIAVPGDISLLGIDAVPDTAMMPYEITHFQVPHGKRSELTAGLLLELMRTPEVDYGREILINVKLIEGQSVKNT